jgi:hypothetical protein
MTHDARVAGDADDNDDDGHCCCTVGDDMGRPPEQVHRRAEVQDRSICSEAETR